jgi:hypothetical protein
LELLKRLFEEKGVRVDWEAYERLTAALREELEWARELRRREADWGYIESRPEPLRTALKLLVETGDLKLASKLCSIPLDELNEERIKAKIPIVVVSLKGDEAPEGA